MGLRPGRMVLATLKFRALAPGNFGDFSNALLIGNFGDGAINAFDPCSGEFLGTIRKYVKRK